MDNRNVYPFTFMCLALCAIGCSSRQPGPRTLDELTTEYNARLKKANSVPTAYAAVLRAQGLLPKGDVSLEADMAAPHGGKQDPKDQRLTIVSKVAQSNGDALKVLKRELGDRQAALAEVRKGRSLPTGMVPLETAGNADEHQLFGRRTRWLALDLYYVALVNLSENDPRAAVECGYDMLTLDDVLRESPSVLDWLIASPVLRMSHLVLLCSALNGKWTGDDLDSMADHLRMAAEYPAVRLLRMFEFNRAEVFDDMDDRMKWSDEEWTKYLSDFYAGIDKLQGLMKNSVHFAPQPYHKLTVTEVRERLPKERAAALEYYRKVEETLRQPGKELDIPDNNTFPMMDPVTFSLRIWGILQYAIMEDLALTRCAEGALRILAFRARNGRPPRSEEITLPEDPFTAGKRLAYEYDEAKHWLSVYAIGWDVEATKEKAPKIGYRLVPE